MARLPGTFSAVLIAVKGGMNPSQLIKALRANGIGARESEVRALYKVAAAMLAKSPTEPFGHPDEIPDLTRAQPWPVISATGVKQAVEVTYRQRATGTLITVPYQVQSDNGVTRQEAIDAAVEAYRTKADSYDQELVGAVHTKVWVMKPMGMTTNG